MKFPLEKIPIWCKNYSEQLDYIFNLRRSHRKRDLDAIKKILNSLRNPHRRYFRILVAGTNGKGSTAAFLERILRESGYRTGLFTSPHLVDFHERFRVSGRLAPAEELFNYLGSLFRLWESELGEEPVFFDFITVLAALYFAEKEVDIAIFEAGIGGERDATNALEPQLGIITQIGLDHCNWLGSRLSDIAFEKGGIFRQGRGAVVGETEPSALSGIYRRIAERNPHPVLFIERDFPDLEMIARGENAQQGLVATIDRTSDTDTASIFTVLGQMVREGWRPSLKGGFQLHNLSVALGAIEVLNREGFSCSLSAVVEAAEDTSWPGRLQEFEFRGERVVVDGAHNPSAARALAESLDSFDNIVIFGAMEDKDWREILRSFSDKLSALILVPIAGQGRSLRPNCIVEEIREFLSHGVMVFPVESLESAMELGIHLKKELGSERILLFGSLYLVGEFFSLLGAEL